MFWRNVIGLSHIILVCVIVYFLDCLVNSSERTLLEDNEDDLMALKNMNSSCTILEGIEKRFCYRNTNLKEACQNLKNKNVLNKITNFASHLFMTKDFNLLACLPGKTGSSTIKRYFTMMNVGTKELLEIDDSKIKAWQLLPMDDLKERMYSRNVRKVLAVRNPLSRLVSAYKDKFTHGKYKPSEEKVFMDLVHKFVPETNGSTDISFAEFLKMIVAERKAKLEGTDGHWWMAHEMCDSCEFSYDYIIKQETYKEDWDHVLKVAGIKGFDSSERINAYIGNVQSDYSYYNEVDQDLLKEIYNIFRNEIQIFGYMMPAFLKKAIQN